MHIHLGIIILLLLLSIFIKYNLYGIENFTTHNMKYPKQILLFFAEWCPHCKNFEPEWIKLKKDISPYLKMRKINGDKNRKTLDKYKVDGYPTIIIKNGSYTTKYEGPMKHKPILDFIKNQFNMI